MITDSSSLYDATFDLYSFSFLSHHWFCWSCWKWLYIDESLMFSITPSLTWKIKWRWLFSQHLLEDLPWLIVLCVTDSNSKQCYFVSVIRYKFSITRIVSSIKYVNGFVLLCFCYCYAISSWWIYIYIYSGLLYWHWVNNDVMAVRDHTAFDKHIRLWDIWMKF